MFCPQCGTESPPDLKFCRTCGANLRVIGKAVTLSEAIARSDSVPAKVKDLVKNLKIEKVTDEVARAMDKVVKKSLKPLTINTTGSKRERGMKFVASCVAAEKRRLPSSVVRACLLADSLRCFPGSDSASFFTCWATQ